MLTGLFRRDPKAWRFVRNILIAFLPAAVIGLIIHDWIETLLGSPVTVAVALVVGGIAILIVERLIRHATIDSVEAMPWKTALGIGFIQCLSMVPGVSRSGATILGALSLGVERKTAAEFSFFLALPTMLGASTLELWSNRHDLGPVGLDGIAIGFVVSFVIALLVIKAFVSIVSRHGFAPFAWYRILAGTAALIWLLAR